VPTSALVMCALWLFAGFPPESPAKLNVEGFLQRRRSSIQPRSRTKSQIYPTRHGAKHPWDSMQRCPVSRTPAFQAPAWKTKVRSKESKTTSGNKTKSQSKRKR
jgi:hypothetical protein